MARAEESTRPGEKAVVPLRCLLSLSHRGNAVTPQASVRWADAASLIAHSAVSLGSHMKTTPSYSLPQGSNTGLPTTGTLLLGPLCADLPDSINSLGQGTTTTLSLGSHVHATLVRRTFTLYYKVLYTRWVP